MFLTWEDVTRLSREIRRMPQPEIDDELRGWSWGESVLSSSARWLLGVSDIVSNFCPNGRDVYLKYILKIKQKENKNLQIGKLIHEVFSEVISNVKNIIYESKGLIDGKKLYEEMKRKQQETMDNLLIKYNLINKDEASWLIDRLWDEAARTYSASLDRALSRSPYMSLESIVAITCPIITEFPIDGSLIGLSRTLRIDAFIPPSIIMELKTRRPEPIYELSIAGYALAFESQYEIPVNHGLLMYVNIDFTARKIYVKPTVVSVTSKLRSEFLELRDNRKEILEYAEDPGIPDKCSQECPYISYCRGSLVE